METIGGRNNDRILEDVFEAFICSIHNDLGFRYAEQFILKIVNNFINFDELEEDTNYKDILLRYCQQNLGTNPCYELVSTSGPAHNKSFISVVLIHGTRYNQGYGKIKKYLNKMRLKILYYNLDLLFRYHLCYQTHLHL